MTFDLSWLWDLLDSIVGTMQSWFSGLWTVAQDIVNTGQGIFAGLVAFGSQIWDAILKGATEFGTWVKGAFEWVYEGLKYWAEAFGSWFNTAMGWIGSGISWVAQQLYNFGYWLYNSMLFVWNWVVNTVTAIWNNIITWFSGVSTAIGSWWSSVITGVNTWFTNLLKTFRQKIITTITADITIAGAWKGAERILAPTKMSDMGYGLVGILASPLVGRLVGILVDAVVPLPSSASYPLIPDITGFTYTPPTLEVTKPTEPAYPEIGVPPSQPALGYGLPLDKVIKQVIGYSVTMESKDKSPTETISYELEVAP